jgi:hypothetical protein
MSDDKPRIAEEDMQRAMAELPLMDLEHPVIRGDRLQQLLRKEITLEDLTRLEREAAEAFMAITASRRAEQETEE